MVDNLGLKTIVEMAQTWWYSDEDSALWVFWAHSSLHEHISHIYHQALSPASSDRTSLSTSKRLIHQGVEQQALSNGFVYKVFYALV